MISIFVGIVTPSLIISKALNIPLEAQNYLLGMVLIIYGILTLVEVQGFSVFRIKFLSIQGTSFHFIPPLILTDQDLIKKGPTPVKVLGP